MTPQKVVPKRVTVHTPKVTFLRVARLFFERARARTRETELTRKSKNRQIRLPWALSSLGDPGDDSTLPARNPAPPVLSGTNYALFSKNGKSGPKCDSWGMVNGSADDFCENEPDPLFVTFRGKTGIGQKCLLLDGSWLPTYQASRSLCNATIRLARIRQLPRRLLAAVLSCRHPDWRASLVVAAAGPREPGTGRGLSDNSVFREHPVWLPASPP